MRLCLQQKFLSGGRTWKVVGVEYDLPMNNQRFQIIEVNKKTVPIWRTRKQTDEQISKGKIELIP
jgi:hypothetical protein